ncbi:MAG: ribonuclease HII [Candidatus Azotimanducaceae bacterium]|jgi:ribonuclease HII
MQDFELIAGVDEVGRGPLAGAVYAAAVVLNPNVEIEGLADSKKLSAKKREALDKEIRIHSVAFSIAQASVEEIDEINILQASMLAMVRAVDQLKVRIDFALVDGNRSPVFYCPSDWVIKGDDKVDSIKAASIIAKVARDKKMRDLDVQYPEYGLAQHKGYPTAAHRSALKKFGVSPIHRLSFGPCRGLFKRKA